VERGNGITEVREIGLQEKATDSKLPSVEEVLREAVDYLAEVFERGEEIDGASLVEWFAEWRQQAQRALSGREK
jgi:hypothetical protein